MRDYDLERAERHQERERLLGDRTFKLGGETFVFKANPSYDVLRQMTQPHLPQLVVLSYNEVTRDTAIESVAMVVDGGAR